MMTEADARAALRAAVNAYGTQRKAAEAYGVSQAFLSDMLNGHRNVSERILARLKLERVVIIRRRLKEKVIA